MLFVTNLTWNSFTSQKVNGNVLLLYVLIYNLKVSFTFHSTFLQLNVIKMLSMQKLSFSLLPAIFFELPITRTFFDFPWRSELSGGDCSTKLKKLVNGKRISIRNVTIGKMGLPFQNFHLFREFSVARTRKSFTIYIPTGIYGNPIGQLCLSGPGYSSPTVINFSIYLTVLKKISVPFIFTISATTATDSFSSRLRKQRDS